jgi:hypothetical protein
VVVVLKGFAREMIERGAIRSAGMTSVLVACGAAPIADVRRDTI